MWPWPHDPFLTISAYIDAEIRNRGRDTEERACPLSINHHSAISVHSQPSASNEQCTLRDDPVRITALAERDVWRNLDHSHFSD